MFFFSYLANSLNKFESASKPVQLNQTTPETYITSMLVSFSCSSRKKVKLSYKCRNVHKIVVLNWGMLNLSNVAFFSQSSGVFI